MRLDKHDVGEHATSMKLWSDIIVNIDRTEHIRMAPKNATLAASFLEIIGWMPQRFPPPGPGTGKEASAQFKWVPSRLVCLDGSS
jgi:hypothetical protein